jgi:hypothetical protein
MNPAFKPTWDEPPFYRCRRRAIINTCKIWKTDTSSARISTLISWYSHIIFELHLVHELQMLYVQLVICVMKQPCTFKEWIDMRNLTQTERS